MVLSLFRIGAHLADHVALLDRFGLSKRDHRLDAL
jgi:hypothetical protein